MAIRRAKYNVQGDTDLDQIHFQTDAKSVHLLNNSKGIVGDLDDLLFKGKTVTSGSVTGLKVNGKYRIKGLTGMPAGVSTTVYHMLEVDTVGTDINNPEFVVYTITTSNNNQQYIKKITANGTDTGWEETGLALAGIINNVNSNLGNVNNLKTNNKVAVNAINELSDKVNTVSTNVNNANNKVNNHNHDTRYIRKDADTQLSAKLNVLIGNGFNMVKADGTKANLISTSPSGQTEIGNTANETRITGKGNTLFYNNVRVWTENNDGKGSGLDADSLQGVLGSKFVNTDNAHTFSKKQTLNGGIGTGAPITWSNGELQFDADGSLNIMRKGNRMANFTAQSELDTQTIVLSGDYSGTGNKEAMLILKENKSSDGFELYYSSGNDRLDLRNQKMDKSIYNVGINQDFVKFSEPIQIGGRKLFLQSDTPSTTSYSGAIPEGSVWIS